MVIDVPNWVLIKPIYPCCHRDISYCCFHRYYLKFHFTRTGPTLTGLFLFSVFVLFLRLLLLFWCVNGMGFTALYDFHPLPSSYKVTLSKSKVSCIPILFFLCSTNKVCIQYCVLTVTDCVLTVTLCERNGFFECTLWFAYHAGFILCQVQDSVSEIQGLSFDSNLLEMALPPVSYKWVKSAVRMLVVVELKD